MAAAAIACAGPSLAGNAHSRPRPPRPALARAITKARFAVETVRFNGGHSVRIVRGAAMRQPPVTPRARGAAMVERTEVIRFGTRPAARVTIVRGGSIPRPTPPPPLRRDIGPRQNIEIVRFADARLAPVTIVRERLAAPAPISDDLFGPADGDELDRVAFAVDGIESRHGADLAMWRPEFDGPQGPMQVSAAAAFDVGGGDRFDMQQNRVLGRAYLAQMFRRYGNWPDALAAYNWGPANVDKWIGGGRDPNELPPGVAWYIRHVLRDAMMMTAASW
jgi:Transglycosylase SLT domain